MSKPMLENELWYFCCGCCCIVHVTLPEFICIHCGCETVLIENQDQIKKKEVKTE